MQPPVAPMLAKLARELPLDGYLYEPKWDGFRCLAFRAGDEIDLRSRNQRPLARYFPELVEALLELPSESAVGVGIATRARAPSSSSRHRRSTSTDCSRCLPYPTVAAPLTWAEVETRPRALTPTG